MSRSGYCDELEQSELAMWRGQVASAIRGKRGQAFLVELLNQHGSDGYVEDELAFGWREVE